MSTIWSGIQKTTLETQMLNCSGRRNWGRTWICRAMNRSWMSAVEMEKLRLILQRLYLEVSDWRRQFSWNDCLCDSHLCVKAVSNLFRLCWCTFPWFWSRIWSVFSNATLHWVDNHKHFLTVQSILRRGGLSYFLRWSLMFCWLALRILAELFWWLSQSYFSMGIHSLWKKAGFNVERLELTNMTHPGKEGLAGWIRTTWMPLHSTCLRANRDNFITHFVETYLERVPLDQSGLAHVRMVRLEVSAVVSLTIGLHTDKRWLVEFEKSRFGGWSRSFLMDIKAFVVCSNALNPTETFICPSTRVMGTDISTGSSLAAFEHPIHNA